MKQSVLFIAAMLMAMGLVGQVNVMPADQSVSKNGVFYSLPKTVINLEVTVERESFFAGPLADYADDYMGLDNVNTSDELKYKIVEIALKKEVIPDPEQFYFIEFDRENMKEKHRFSVSLQEAGLLTGFNKESFDKKTEVKSVMQDDDDLDVDKKALFDYQAVQSVQQEVDTIIRQITVDTSMVSEMQTRKQWVRKTRKEKAQDVAERIQKIMQDRYYLSIGYQEVAYDEGAIRFMDERLKKRQQEYEALFTGKTVTSRQTYRFEFSPEKTKNIQEEALFKFSERSGVRNASSSIGEPVKIRIASDNITENIEKKAKMVAQSSQKRKGIYYRIPGSAMVSITSDEESLHSRRFSINQLGVVSFAPYSRNMGFELHPESGALKKVDYLFDD